MKSSAGSEFLHSTLKRKSIQSKNVMSGDGFGILRRSSVRFRSWIRYFPLGTSKPTESLGDHKTRTSSLTHFWTIMSYVKVTSTSLTLCVLVEENLKFHSTH